MPAPGAKGRLSDAMRHLLMRRATVTACDPVAGKFRLITLEGPALRRIDWTPGQKVQIAMAAPFVTRTYTPMEWDASIGRTRLLCYAHADGPGSAWARDIKPGDGCDVFGPRKSLDLPRMAGPIALFGDETSIGLACALGGQRPPCKAVCHLEIDDVEAAERVAERLNLSETILFARRTDDAHLQQMEAALPSLVAAGGSFVLTGRSTTVQRLRQRLKHLEVPVARIAIKAYWASGKSGLD